MRLAIIMMNFRQILTGNMQMVGQIVISGGHDYLAGAVIVDAAITISGGDAEVVVLASNRLHPLVLAYVQAMMLGNLAVVLQGFLTRRLLMGSAERHVAYLKQFRRSEEGHVRGIVEEGINQASLIQNDDPQADFLGFDGAGETGRTGADDQHIAVHVSTRVSGHAGESVWNQFGRQSILPRG